MKIEHVSKDAFAVIGREGSTRDGDGFVQRLWQDANAHFDEIADLVKREEDGSLTGLWGAMSDFSRSFRPWDDFSRGLYLAGAECRHDAEAPAGWARWVLPASEYLKVDCEGGYPFQEMLRYMKEHGLPLAGAVYDHTCPRTGRNFLFFPIQRR